jgi:hypothetical protein
LQTNITASFITPPSNVERVIGSFNLFLVITLAWALDWVARFVIETTYGGSIPGSGPYAILMAIFGLYAVFLPTVRAPVFGVNEKVAAVLLLASIGIIDGFRLWLPVAVGFIAFLITAPFFYPVTVKSS